jgi:hypothetical protein
LVLKARVKHIPLPLITSSSELEASIDCGIQPSRILLMGIGHGKGFTAAAQRRGSGGLACSTRKGDARRDNEHRDRNGMDNELHGHCFMCRMLSDRTFEIFVTTADPLFTVS